MGQVPHGSATTTEAIRRAIQHSQESLRALAKRYGINPKTVAKWKARPTVTDKKTGPKAPRSTVLSVEEEAVVVERSLYSLNSIPLHRVPPCDGSGKLNHEACPMAIPIAVPMTIQRVEMITGLER